MDILVEFFLRKDCPEMEKAAEFWDWRNQQTLVTFEEQNGYKLKQVQIQVETFQFNKKKQLQIETHDVLMNQEQVWSAFFNSNGDESAKIWAPNDAPW